MNDHLLVVTTTGFMWKLDSLISEHGFSENVGGNKNIPFFLIATKFSISAGIWAARPLIFFLVERTP